MNSERFLRVLLTEIEPNATVVGIDELPRDEVAAAQHSDEPRRRVATVLKRCADDVVAPVGDGRA